MLQCQTSSQPVESLAISDLPIVRENGASLGKMGHLPTKFYCLADEIGASHAPIPKRDMERVAGVEALGSMN